MTFPDDALCATSPHVGLWDRSIWGESVAEQEARWQHAAAICARCPVRLQCFAHGHANDLEGVWGGIPLPLDSDAARPTPERAEIPHGTEAGYKAHRRRGEDPCPACVLGNRFKRATKRQPQSRRTA